MQPFFGRGKTRNGLAGDRGSPVGLGSGPSKSFYLSSGRQLFGWLGAMSGASQVTTALRARDEGSTILSPAKRHIPCK